MVRDTTQSSDPVMDLSCFGNKPRPSQQKPVGVTVVPLWIFKELRVLCRKYVEIYWELHKKFSDHHGLDHLLGPDKHFNHCCGWEKLFKQRNTPVCPGSQPQGREESGVSDRLTKFLYSPQLSPSSQTHIHTQGLIVCLFQRRLLRRL